MATLKMLNNSGVQNFPDGEHTGVRQSASTKNPSYRQRDYMFDGSKPRKIPPGSRLRQRWPSKHGQRCGYHQADPCYFSHLNTSGCFSHREAALPLNGRPCSCFVEMFCSRSFTSGSHWPDLVHISFVRAAFSKQMITDPKVLTVEYIQNFKLMLL